MGRFNKLAQDKVRQRRSRDNDRRCSHVPTANEKNAAANHRVIDFSVGPFDVSLYPLETSILRRAATPADRTLGRMHATVNVDAERVRAIDEFKVQNLKSREAVVLWKKYGPDPFQFNRLMSPAEANDEDLLWKLASDRLHAARQSSPGDAT